MQGVQNSDLETANDPSRALDMIHDIEEVFEDFKRKLSGSYLHLRESLKNDMQSTLDKVFCASRAKSARHDRELNKLSDVRRNLEIKISALNQETEELRFESEQAKKICNGERQDSQRKYQALVDSIACLEKDNNHLKGEEERYRQACLEKDGAYAILRKSHANAIHSCQALKESIKILQAQLVNYRDIILKRDGAATREPNDATIIQDFQRLGEGIQRVMAFCTVKNPPLRPQDPTQNELILLSYWQCGMSASEIKNRIRGKVFHWLHKSLLLQAYFGLETINQGEIEKALVDFEHMIRKSSSDDGAHADFATWRITTLKCAKLLNTKESPLPSDTAKQLISFLEPIRIRCNDEASDLVQRDKLEKLLMKLCTDAFDLSMHLRGCRNTYLYDVPRDGEVINTDEAEAQCEEQRQKPGDDKGKENIVAYALSGTLVKIAENNPENRVILQKAWVVVECD
ncbi:hypothetical protein MFRU_049g00230 [Monilinia fructicola]|nr:hypothetical protein MFRU_049g00230 [Monilinia fructicola]